MNKKIRILASLFIMLTLLLGGLQEAQAKRLGGGSSFGSRPSYSAPYQRSTTPSPSSQPSRSASQQQAVTQNQTARQSWANRGGLMGMLGGLALGGLLGSLFFGGAFEHFNFMDILIFGLIAYLLYRLFAAKTAPQHQSAGQAYGRNQHSSPAYRTEEPVSAAGFDTDVLSNKAGIRADNAAAPADFDRQAFLAGAENAYRYLQAAWDRRDLAAIRGLSTDKVFAEIQEQLQASRETNRTEILQLNAQLLEVNTVGADLEAAVLFDGLLRENDAQPESIREVWHFTKPVNSSQPKWFLDGIQQLEA